MDPRVIAHRLQAMRNHAKLDNKVGVVEQLNKQLASFNYTGVHPEISGPMIGHCGLWQVVVEQMTCAICNRPLLTLNSPISIQ